MLLRWDVSRQLKGQQYRSAYTSPSNFITIVVPAADNLAENKAGEEKIKLLRPNSRDHPSCAVHANDRAPIVSRKIVSKQKSAVNEHEIEFQAPLPKFKRLGYFTEPAISELAAMEMSKPDFLSHVKDFVVGCHGYGHVTFEGEIDVCELDLDSFIHYNTWEVIVYMNESDKPPAGQGLNTPAEVTLLNVKCVNPNSGILVEKYSDMLKKVAEKQGDGSDCIFCETVKGD